MHVDFYISFELCVLNFRGEVYIGFRYNRWNYSLMHTNYRIFVYLRDKYVVFSLQQLCQGFLVETY